MKDQTTNPPPKPIPMQIRILVSMMYQIKDRFEINRWMKTQDVYEAHPALFRKMGQAVERDYGLDITPTYCFKAIEIFVAGMHADSFVP
jgi:hypothetical protein